MNYHRIQGFISKILAGWAFSGILALFQFLIVWLAWNYLFAWESSILATPQNKMSLGQAYYAAFVLNLLILRIQGD